MLKFQKAIIRYKYEASVFYNTLFGTDCMGTGLSRSSPQATVSDCVITYNSSKEEHWYFIFSLVLILI